MKIGFEAKSAMKAARRAALLALALFALAGPAPAQDSGLGGFLQHLFGAPAPAAAPTPTPTPSHKPRKRDFVPASTTRAPGAPGGEPVQANFHVEVIGDSLAVIAADGLAEALADKPEIAVVGKAHDASGLVRDDYFNWPRVAADDAVAGDKPDYVVMMLGINDIQPLHDGPDLLDTFSDKWRERYGQRIEATAAPYRAAHIPLLWVGLPPMRTERVNEEAIQLNGLFKEHAEKAGAKFVDIWDAFANEDGEFDAFGPNVEGQKVKLRASDGIHFTKAGGRKLAHFLESEIRHDFEKRNPASEITMLPPDIEQAADDINAQIRREMGQPEPPPVAGAAAPPAPKGPPPRPLAGPILSLAARPTSPGGALLARDARLPAEPPELMRVLRQGEPPEPRPGRADDFVWPRG